MEFHGKVTHHARTIPLNFGGDPDSRSGIRIGNNKILKSQITRKVMDGFGRNFMGR